VSKGQSKPETVSVRIKEDDYAVIAEVATHYGVKNVDAIEKLVDAWTMLSEEDQDMVFLGDAEGPEEPEENPVIYKTDPLQSFQVVYKKAPPPE
tara:strand:+ start:335 stop:616 length:282 start_codon:yes stop_codon:yes gene_type:complete